MVMRMMLRQGSLLIIAGLVVGSVVAVAAERVLSSSLQLMPGGPPEIYLGVALFLAGVALCAMLGPSLRATRVDPVAAIRHDG